MLSLLLSLILFFLASEGKSEVKASPREATYFNKMPENQCDEHVNVDFMNENPLIYKKKNIKKGTIICINSSNIYMSIIFHSWKNFEAKTFRTYFKPNRTSNLISNLPSKTINQDSNINIINKETKSNQNKLNFALSEINDTIIIEDGPYTEKEGSIIGFYFGRHIGQIRLKALKNNAVLSFGLIIFNELSTLRIISNNKEDTLKFIEPRNHHEFACNRHIQYFNGLPGSQSYNIDMNIDEDEDYINFRNSKKCSMNYTGELSIQKRTTEEEPQILNFFTNSNHFKNSSNNRLPEKKLDVYLQIEESSNFDKSKKYGRMWTSSSKYATIPAFSYSENSIGWVILTVILTVVFVILVVALIAFIIFRKRKSSFVKCNDVVEEGIVNNTEDEGQTSKSTKAKRRMLFESVVTALHTPKNKNKNETIQSSQKNDDGIAISQSNLLSQENEK